MLATLLYSWSSLPFQMCGHIEHFALNAGRAHLLTLQCNNIVRKEKRREAKQQRHTAQEQSFSLGLGYTDYWSNTACFHKNKSVIQRDSLHGSLTWVMMDLNPSPALMHVKVEMEFFLNLVFIMAYHNMQIFIPKACGTQSCCTNSFHMANMFDLFSNKRTRTKATWQKLSASFG